MLGTTSAIQTKETVLADDSADKLAAESRRVSKDTSILQAKFLVEESFFHRFIKRAKGHLAIVGQRLSFVFAKYAVVPVEPVKALDQLTGAGALDIW